MAISVRRKDEVLSRQSAKIKELSRDLAASQKMLCRRDDRIKALSAQLRATQKALAAVQALNFSPVQDPSLVSLASKALKTAAALQT